MNDIMLDLETFGISYNALIVQIGACYFDRYSGKIGKTFFYNVNHKYNNFGFDIDASTVLWWLKQSKEAQELLTVSPISSISTILLEFNKFLRDGVNIWAHGTFDPVVLTNAFKKTGITPNYTYQQPKDIRTLTDLANVDPKTYEMTGTAHSALDDCLFQVKYSVDCFNILKK